jgi:hypothetical protein
MQKQYFDEEAAISELLDNGILFSNFRKYECPITKKYGNTIVLFLVCNDTFGYACADAEDIEEVDQLEKLYRYWKADPVWGATRFVIEKRKKRPTIAVQNRMVEHGVWKEDYEQFI